MMRISKVLFALLVVSGFAEAQSDFNEKPKLMVGIVVDQMRYEYLHRYYDTFGQGGFKRLINEGFVLENAHYNYTPTVTGPGHASVYTGTTPSIHGIIGNDWYDKELNKYVNCVNDPLYEPVGSPGGNGDVSPWRMQSTTVTDELKISSQGNSKVISISWKDRGAVLPGGHTPNGAYWVDSKSTAIITSTYYQQQLPKWLVDFNKRGLPDLYLSGSWKPIMPIEKYIQSGIDNSPYENKLAGKETPTFPYDLKELRAKAGDYDLLYVTPFSNDYITEAALAALNGEKLGKGQWSDFLAISYSATDALGHAVGPNGVELQDMYIRLDKNLEHLLNKLDEQVGKGNYTVFLTADHAVAEVPQFMIDNKLPGGYLDNKKIREDLNAYLALYFPGKELVKIISNGQVFFNHDVFDQDPKSAGVQLLVASELTTQFLKKVEGIADVYSQQHMTMGDYNEGGLKGMAIRGYHQKRSGDLVIIPESGYFSSSSKTGTTHGTGYSYDTHVPILFYGKGIKKGSTNQYHRITDIAPTVSRILKIQFPSGTTGQPIVEILD